MERVHILQVALLPSKKETLLSRPCNVVITGFAGLVISILLQGH